MLGSLLYEEDGQNIQRRMSCKRIARSGNNSKWMKWKCEVEVKGSED